MGNIKDYDLLGWAEDKDIKNIIGDEKYIIVILYQK